MYFNDNNVFTVRIVTDFFSHQIQKSDYMCSLKDKYYKKCKETNVFAYNT